MGSRGGVFSLTIAATTAANDNTNIKSARIHK